MIDIIIPIHNEGFEVIKILRRIDEEVLESK